jgi:hypothetical protein
LYLGLLKKTIGIPEQAPDDGAGKQGCDRQSVSGILLILFGQQAPALYNPAFTEKRPGTAPARRPAIAFSALIN